MSGAVLKRKRSDSEISSCSSVLSTPPRFHSLEAFSPPSFAMREFTPLHLSSRTRKRVRDNRPPESAIHQNTLSILFSAQKNKAQSSPAPLQMPVLEPVPSPHHQASLHSFWAIPSRPSSLNVSDAGLAHPPTSRLLNTATNCEDCNSSLNPPDSDAMDMDMDIDIDIYTNDADYACTICAKQVCHGCAISNLGAQRRCLICAGKRRWIGGLGWMDSD